MRNKPEMNPLRRLLFTLRAGLAALLVLLAGCAPTAQGYRDPNMDFGSLHTIAVLPFANLSRETNAGDRIRDIFVTSLLATGGVYVLPVGEVARGMARANFGTATAPAVEDAIKLGSILKADALITGVVREYGEMRSGSTSANVVAVSVQMIETQSGRTVWNATTSRGGIGFIDRLFGGGGQAMNEISEQAVHDLIDQLF
jgi:polysaccharide biosynthesis protein PelC